MNTKIEWKYKINGARQVSQRPPIICKNLVLANFNYGQGSNYQGTLSAISVESGEEKWRFNTNHYLNEPSISKDGFIYITCFDGSVFKLDHEGLICWKSRPSESNLWSGLLINNYFVYAEISGRAKYTRALDCIDGSVKWEYENGGHSYALASDSSSRVIHCSVSGGVNNQKIYFHCLDINSGKPVWKTEYDQYLFRPLIDGKFIYIGSRGHIALFDLDSGQLLTRYSIEEGIAVTAPPMKAETGVVFLTESGRIFQLSKVTSEKGTSTEESVELIQNWSCDISSEVKASMLLINNDLLLISETGNLVTINAITGEITKLIKISGFKKGYGIARRDNNLIIAVSNECRKLINT
jgi:outer membrane protein assembly factor BamB